MKSLTAIMIFVTTVPCLAEEYQSYRDAMSAAAKFLRDRNYAGSQKPLEAALKLATTDDERMKTYRTLIPAYRQLSDHKKMTEACSFIIEKSDHSATRAVTATTLVSFYQNRGLLEVAIDELENRLSESKDDLVALNVLTKIYQRPRRDADRHKELSARLSALDQKLAAKKAEGLEQQASETSDQAATFYAQAGLAWLEAKDEDKALAAVKHSLEAKPESRSQILVYYWRIHLGDVLAGCDRASDAIKQYELAIEAASSEPLKRPIKAKIEKLTNKDAE